MSMYNGTLYAEAPPDGVIPNENNPYEASSLIGVTAVFFPFAVISLAARVYSRIAITGKVDFDDYLMAGALACSAVLTALIFNMLKYGLGKDLWDVPMSPNLYPNFMLDNVIAAIFFCAATGFAKGSLLLFYLRIFPGQNFRLAVWLLFAFTIGYSIASMLVNVFSCDPVQGSWQLEYAATARCINRPVFYFVQAGLGIFTDITTVVAPLPALKSLHLPAKQKIGVALILFMGAFVCIVSVVRLQSLYVLLSDSNLTKNTTTALMWCVLELNLSIVGGCIPAIKPLLQRMFPRLLSSSARSGYYASGGTGSQARHGYAPHLKSSGATLASRTSDHFKSSSRLARGEETASEEYIMHHHQPQITKTVEFGYEVATLNGDKPSVAKRDGDVVW